MTIYENLNNVAGEPFQQFISYIRCHMFLSPGFEPSGLASHQTDTLTTCPSCRQGALLSDKCKLTST